MPEAEDLLGRGLIHGYASGVKPDDALRGSFRIKISKYLENEGLADRGVYRDEWTSGGGQEIAWSAVDYTSATRVYAGGVANRDVLERLRVTKTDVINHLKHFVSDSQGKTRMGMNYSAQYQEWRYQYEVIRRLRQNLNLTLGLETIHFKGELVFAHGFAIAPIDKI